MSSLTKKEVMQRVRESLGLESREKTSKIANLLQLVGNSPRMPFQQKMGQPMVSAPPPATPDLVGQQESMQTNTLAQQYPFLGGK